MPIPAKRVETILDDGEGLSSFLAAWLDAGGYFSVAKEWTDEVIYCELNDQSHGFASRTVKYAMNGHEIRFWVTGDEYFDRSRRVNEIEILIRDEELDIKEISDCLQSIFGTA